MSIHFVGSEGKHGSFSNGFSNAKEAASLFISLGSAGGCFSDSYVLDLTFHHQYPTNYN
jgi:hypothetical protein